MRMGLWLVFASAAVVAQPLDVTIAPVIEGTVQAIRQVHVNPQTVAPIGSVPQPVGVPSEIEDSAPLGAVAARPIGVPKGERKWRFGTPSSAEMEDRFAHTGYELLVTMDDGEQRVFHVGDASRFHPGQRIRVRHGEVEPL
jgi:outer membrane lipoprotein SlyB